MKKQMKRWEAVAEGREEVDQEKKLMERVNVLFQKAERYRDHLEYMMDYERQED